MFSCCESVHLQEGRKERKEGKEERKVRWKEGKEDKEAMQITTPFLETHKKRAVLLANPLITYKEGKKEGNRRRKDGNKGRKEGKVRVGSNDLTWGRQVFYMASNTDLVKKKKNWDITHIWAAALSTGMMRCIGMHRIQNSLLFYQILYLVLAPKPARKMGPVPGAGIETPPRAHLGQGTLPPLRFDKKNKLGKCYHGWGLYALPMW